MHLAPLILDLAIILAVAGLISAIFLKIRQPVVLGYILAGVVVGPHTPPFQLVTDVPSIQTWAELGVIFLMFTLGLEFSFRKLLSVGLTAGITAGLEVLFFLIVGYAIGISLGWTQIESFYLGAMLSISSTTIIIKALDELKLKSHRFAGIIFGILIVEDLLAILLIVALTAIAKTQTISPMALAGTTLNLVLVIASWFIFGHLIIPRMMSYIAKKGTNEMVTLVSIGLCLMLVVFATRIGYSPALGAFIMGSILAETRIISQIENLMAPLRDLFGAIFFVSIGMLIDPRVIWEFKGTICLLCIVTILGKIFITSLGALITGQNFKNSVQVGFGLAQIGEFSFIIAGLGVSLKAINSDLYPIAVAVSLVTTFTTPYLIKYSATFAEKMEGALPEKIKNALSRYTFWWEHQKSKRHDVRPVLRLMGRWLIYGIIVTVIFNNSFKGLAPKVLTNFPDLNNWHLEITWMIAFILSSPFILGMIFAPRKTYIEISKEKKLFEVFFIISFPALTSIWIGYISVKYIPLRYVLPATFLFLSVIYFFLYKKLESYYGKFEGKFLKTFEKKVLNQENESFSELAPWDSHLFSFEVHPNAYLVNQSLIDANLRKKFGINIVAIKRGMKTIVAPRAHEKILPMDSVIVLGTDKQLDLLRPHFEASPEIADNRSLTTESYFLKHLELSISSVLVGKSIQDSLLREHFQALVVGVERKDARIMNPDKDFTFEAGDTVWIVGEKSLLEELILKLN